MIAPASLARCIGREIDLFGTEYTEDGDMRLIMTGRLVAIEDGCLALASEDEPDGEVGWIVDLQVVGLVALRAATAEAPKLKVISGDKVRRLQREQDPDPAA